MLPVETKTPRARRHEENHAKIVAAAMEMLAHGGYADLSMNRLAEAVGFTPGALYRYFTSKDALLATVMERALEEVRGFLMRAEASLPKGASPLARALALLQGYRAFARLRPERFGLLAMAMAEPRVLLQKPDEAARVVGVMVAALSPLSEALAAAEAEGLVSKGDPNERTIVVFALLQGVLQLHKQARYAPSILDLDRLVLRGPAALLSGWGAEPKPLEKALRQAAPIASALTLDGGLP